MDAELCISVHSPPHAGKSAVALRSVVFKSIDQLLRARADQQHDGVSGSIREPGPEVGRAAKFLRDGRECFRRYAVRPLWRAETNLGGWQAVPRIAPD